MNFDINCFPKAAFEKLIEGTSGGKVSHRRSIQTHVFRHAQCSELDSTLGENWHAMKVVAQEFDDNGECVGTMHLC